MSNPTAGAASSNRLVDYFAILGMERNAENLTGLGNCTGRILQRFPCTDWPDVPFFKGIELFCQPCGWRLHTKFQQPCFFVSVLTDIGADRHYLAALCFFEPLFASVAGGSLSPAGAAADALLDDDTTSTGGAGEGSPLNSETPTTNLPFVYAPKCFVLVSRHCYFEVFKNCLTTIFSVYIDKLPYEIETLVANLVSGITVPATGTPQINFSLGANDRQAIQPAQCSSLPVTKNCIALLFQELGIYNVLCLFSAVLTDRKILFLSQSYSRLTKACHALSSLIFPLKYSYVYVPLLPGSLIEVLHSPTPFIMGLPYSFKNQLADLTEIVFADIDTGSVFVPDGVTIPPLPEPYNTRLVACLTLVLNKELYSADFAFRSNVGNNVPLIIQDKQIRACFLRLFSDLLTDYRSCLRVVRVYPKPFITFHKAAFLGMRGFQEDEFMNKLLDSMSFQAFISDRGLPYRLCDVFDDVCASFGQTLKDENENLDKVMDNLVVLAQQLLENECPSNQSFLHNIQQPSEASLNNTVPHPFPQLDTTKVTELIEENLEKNPGALNIALAGSSRLVSICQPQEVPCSAPKSSLYKTNGAFTGNTRRLDVLRLCLRCIFENKVSDARKMLSAVQLSMKSPTIRVAFCQELHSGQRLLSRAALEAHQFDLIVRLINCALQNESSSDEYGIAYAMLSLATVYCRRLSTGVMQFAYTCVQDHNVWKNHQFWESAFFHDVHCELRHVYAPTESPRRNLMPFGASPSKDVWNLTEEPSILKIMADKAKSNTWVPQPQLDELKSQEDAIVYSQAIHYANRIVYFLVPMDFNRLRRVNVKNLEENSSCSVSVSNVSSNQSAEEDSTTESDVESGFMEGNHKHADLGQDTVRFISKFLDKVCCDSGLASDRLRQLHLMIPGVVAMQIETLENVYKESKKLPPIHKPRMLVPTFLPGEQMLQGYLRVYLLPDGRCEAPKYHEKLHVNNYLPAEGAIFLTNYRIIFIGQSCDPYICDKVIMRIIPVMAMTKQKKIKPPSMNTTEQAGHYLREVLQIRSATFQLMKIAFDEEVSTDKVQNFYESLEKLRWPEEIWNIFALSSSNAQSITLTANQHLSVKDKSATIKGMAKTVWKKTAKKAGFHKSKIKDQNARNLPSRYTQMGSQGGSSTTRRVSPGSDENGENLGDKNSPQETSRGPIVALSGNLSRTLDRLTDRSYCQDYQRLGLCSRVEVALHSGGTGTLNSGRQATNRNQDTASSFRLTVANRTYSICRSYPAVLAIPAKLNDESLKKIAKGHKHGRFPVVTWCSNNGAFIVRGAGFNTRSVVSRLRNQKGYNPTSNQNNLAIPDDFTSTLSQQQVTLKSSVEQERYFAYLVALSPQTAPRHDSSNHSLGGSLLSLDSLLLANLDAVSQSSSALGGASGGGGAMGTPDPSRRGGGGSTMVGSLQKAMGAAVRSSQGAGQHKTMTMRLGLKPGHVRTPFFGNQSNRTDRSASSTMAPSSTGVAPRFLTVQDQKRFSVTSAVSDTSSINFSSNNNNRDLAPSSTAAQMQTLRRASLYVFGEKSQAKVIKLDSRCEFIPVNYPDAHGAKESLKKMRRVAAPASHSQPDQNYSHLKALEESGWLQQIKSLLNISNAIVDLIDLQNSSVAVCLEYGWDATTQIVSLAQLMLDPFYRTLDGFRVLIEKEWLSFGHRFSHRCVHTLLSSSSDFAPIFLQFLDTVYQIQSQYPWAFEFNEFYLRFLAYHSTSAYFRTFILDSEAERVESGLINFDAKPRHRPTDLHFLPLMDENGLPNDNSVGSPTNSAHHQNLHKQQRSCSLGGHHHTGSANLNNPLSNASFWDYVGEKHRRSAIFNNFLYRAPNSATIANQKVLRPDCSLAALQLWPYYCMEELCNGSLYDLETLQSDNETHLASDDVIIDPVTGCVVTTHNAKRRVVDLTYESSDFTQPNGFSRMLEEVFILERDSDVLPQQWSQVFGKMVQNVEQWNHNEDESSISDVSTLAPSQWNRWLSRTWHKKATLELLLKGRMVAGQSRRDRSGLAGSNSGDPGLEHTLVKHNFATPEHCQVCNRVLWGVLKQGLKCSKCDFCCHEKCGAVAPNTCSYNLVRNSTLIQSSVASLNNNSAAETQQKFEMMTQNFDNFISHQVETRTHEGYLMKRGAFLKSWKQRWFVLDSIKHELRYYDAMEDSHCKGCIDLSEVSTIGSVPAPPGSPKSIEGAFFELRTARRTYSFMANNQKAAHEWVEKIQACLQ